jgi:SAM-dependent methyltransferase
LAYSARSNFCGVDGAFMIDRIDVQELMDLPAQPVSDLAASLRDLRAVNRFLGGTSVTLGHLRRSLRKSPPGATITLIDVATGGGDIPRAVVSWGRRRGLALRYVCLDANPSVLDAAERESRAFPELSFVQGDARRIAFEDRSFDYATCSLALHHFDPEDAVRVLSEMDRITRKGWVLNDLRRSGWGWLGIWILTRLLPANRLTRHDGPVSVLRAYLPAELEDLAERAGIRGAKLTSHPFCRMALTADKAGAAR